MSQYDDHIAAVTEIVKRIAAERAPNCTPFVEYAQTGGHVMCVGIYPNDDYRWLFGTACGNWGGSLDGPEPDCALLLEVGSDFDPDTADVQTVAEWIWTTVFGSEVIESGGVHMENPYMDESGRFAVDPWITYGIPFPAGIGCIHERLQPYLDKQGTR